MDSRGKIVKAGFSFIEIMVAMMIVAIMASQIPRLTKTKRAVFDECVMRLNALALNAYNHALISGKITQLFFDLTTTPCRVHIRQETDKQEGPQQKTIYELVQSEFGNDSMIFDEQLNIEKFIIEGKDEMAGAGAAKTVWFYIMPDGTAQQVNIGIYDTETTMSSELQLNPFFVQFKVVS